MKKKIRKLNEIHIADIQSVKTNARNHINTLNIVKRVCNLLILICFAAVFNSCVVGWVASEPSYRVEIERPARPGNEYIWIEGGWRWDNGRHDYIREPGYWAKPKPNHSYLQGHWKSGPRGKSWVKGRWKKEHDRDEDHR